MITLKKIYNIKGKKDLGKKKDLGLFFIGKYQSIAEAEVPILWPPDAKSRLFGKDPDAGRD